MLAETLIQWLLRVLNKTQNKLKKYEILSKNEQKRKIKRQSFLIKHKTFMLTFFILGYLSYTAIKSFVITYTKITTKNKKESATRHIRHLKTNGYIGKGVNR